MFVFSDISDVMKSLDPLAIIQRVFSMPDIKDYLIDAIQLRLHEKGITATGKQLRTDSAIEQNEGKVYSRNNPDKSGNRWVDLYMEGDFYKSFAIKEDRTGFEVSANFDKPEGYNIYDNFGISFSSFDTFEKEILSPVYDQYFQSFAEDQFLQVFFEVVTDYLVTGLSAIKV